MPHNKIKCNVWVNTVLFVLVNKKLESKLSAYTVEGFWFKSLRIKISYNFYLSTDINYCSYDFPKIIETYYGHWYYKPKSNILKKQ